MRALRTLLAAGMLVALLAPVAVAQAGLQISTTYPAVAVEPGETTNLALVVSAAAPTRVALEVSEVPEGWTATLRGGGFVVDSVFVDPAAPEPADLQLAVDVPAEVTEGRFQVTVTASAGGETAALPIDLRVTEAVAGSVELTSEFPSLRGAPDDAFNFSLSLQNNTPEETSFSLRTEGPEGWFVEAQLASQAQAATATVAGGSSESINVDVDPPDDAEAGTYTVGVTAEGGGKTATAELTVEVTGSTEFSITTPDERLNARVVAGTSTDVALIVVNEGTSPLTGLALTADAPQEWEVTFEPEAIEVPAGEILQVTAKITPSGDSVAGDYLVTITGDVEGKTSEVQLRTTVETSQFWGLVGFLLIALAIGALLFVFRYFGRR